MALFPVQGIVEGDFVIVLVPVDDTDPMTVVAEKIAHHGVGKRVAAHRRVERAVVAFEASVAQPERDGAGVHPDAGGRRASACENGKCAVH